MKIIRAILFILGFGVIAYSAFAADQVKTTDTYIYSSDAAITTAQNASVPLYIGDNLVGVTTPVKSLYFVASGVYTGGGTFTLSIDSDLATTQAFTLPTVTNPTPFEFIYNDPSNKISPTSAGSYAYTLNMTPSGVTLYGLGVKMSETHQYAPPTCADGASSNQKVKTTDTYIYSSDAAITTAQNASVPLYIGDNLVGVTTPVKSLYFVASGLYTGGGSLSLSIDNDAATTLLFTLPTVTNPTPFEFIYNDPSNKISPTSAGSYTYTLNMTPSGVTLYGLGVKMSETHQYAPPTCGGTLPVLGDLISAVFDSTNTAGAGYNSVMWHGTLNSGAVRFQFAGADANTGPWAYYGASSGTCNQGDWFNPGAPGTPVELKGIGCQALWNNKRYFRYKVEICSAANCIDNGATSPIIDNIVVNWAP